MRGVMTILPAVDLDAKTTGIPSCVVSAPVFSIIGGKVPDPKPVNTIPSDLFWRTASISRLSEPA